MTDYYLLFLAPVKPRDKLLASGTQGCKVCKGNTGASYSTQLAQWRIHICFRFFSYHGDPQKWHVSVVKVPSMRLDTALAISDEYQGGNMLSFL